MTESTSEQGWTYASEGITRRILEHTPDLMTVAVRLEEGAVAEAHSHPHIQSTYVLSGQYEFTVGDEVKKIGPGDTLMIPGNTIHSGHCIEAGELLDIFTPRRDDFL